MSWAGGATLTAAAMAFCGWAVTGIDMAGPRPGTRIALLVPQIEVSLVFLLAVPWCAWSFAGRWSPGMRTALAVTRRGGWLAARDVCEMCVSAVAPALVAGAATWTAAMALPGGPSVGRIVLGRVLLAAFLASALGIAAFAAALTRTRTTAVAVAISVVGAMAIAPFAIDPMFSTFGTQPLVAQAVMLANPWTVTAGAAGLDLIRMQWFYALSPLAHIEVHYPDPGVATLAYAASGTALLCAAVPMLRLSYGRRGAR